MLIPRAPCCRVRLACQTPHAPLARHRHKRAAARATPMPLLLSRSHRPSDGAMRTHRVRLIALTFGLVGNQPIFRNCRHPRYTAAADNTVNAMLTQSRVGGTPKAGFPDLRFGPGDRIDAVYAKRPRSLDRGKRDAAPQASVFDGSTPVPSHQCSEARAGSAPIGAALAAAAEVERSSGQFPVP